MRVTRSNTIKSYHRKLRAGVSERAHASLKESGEHLMSEAKSMTPVDDDQLRPSAHILTKKKTRSILHMEYGFGGRSGIGNVRGETNTEDVDYAIIQHENPEFNHAPGTQSLFLLQPWLRRRRDLINTLKRDIIKFLRTLRP